MKMFRLIAIKVVTVVFDHKLATHASNCTKFNCVDFMISRNISFNQFVYILNHQLFVYNFFQEDVNVICVNWSAGAADPNYVRAAVNTRLVGRQVALLIENINNSNDEKINAKTHMIGFSLGAHVAGFAGNQLKNLSRITGKPSQKLREII